MAPLSLLGCGSEQTDFQLRDAGVQVSEHNIEKQLWLGLLLTLVSHKSLSVYKCEPALETLLPLSASPSSITS